MAIVESPTWQVTVTFVDNDNNKGYVSFELPGASLYADAYTDATAVATAMAALSNAEIQAIHLLKTAYEDALNFATLSEASDVERKGRFQFQGASPAVRSSLEIPSIDNAFVVEGTNVIDVNNATVAAFITAYLTTAGVVTNRGEPLTTVLGGPRKIHRRSNKG